MDKKSIELRKQQIIERVKQKLQAYVDKGGILEELTAKDEEYVAVKNCDIYLDGKRLSVEERFSYFGFPRNPQQKPFAEKLKDIKKMLDEFVANGGNVNEIDYSHPIYTKMRAFTPIINGRKPSMEEKFEMAGHPRQSRYNDMNSFFERLSELENYKDENGFVDGYRKDEQMKLFVSYCSLQFGFPVSLVVCLLADQKLKKHVVITNRVEFLRTRLTKYLEEHKDFIGIKRIDPPTYNLLTSITKTYPTENGMKLSSLELVELLGFEGVINSFSNDVESEPFSEMEFMKKYANIIEKNNGVISSSDIQQYDYNQLTYYLRRINQTKQEFFARYNVKFSNPRIVERNKRILLPEYPYLDEMQQKLYDQLLDMAKAHPELKKASTGELFALKAELIRSIYEEYRTRIEEKHILGSQELLEKQPNKEYS